MFIIVGQRHYFKWQTMLMSLIYIGSQLLPDNNITGCPGFIFQL